MMEKIRIDVRNEAVKPGAERRDKKHLLLQKRIISKDTAILNFI